MNVSRILNVLLLIVVVVLVVKIVFFPSQSGETGKEDTEAVVMETGENIQRDVETRFRMIPFLYGTSAKCRLLALVDLSTCFLT